MSTDLGTDEEPARAPIRVSADGVIVRKIASTRGDEAVVVDLTLRSGRDDKCRVRVEDPIPAALADNPVEFHPRYDPANWTQVDGAVIYDAPIGPGVVRRTVYGIVVNDPTQVDLFRTPPAVETVEVEDEPPPSPDGDESFEFGAADQSDDGSATPAATERDARAVDRSDRDSVVESLVAELRTRELSQAERDALREAIGPGVEPGEVDELRETLRELEARTDDLAAAIERESRWRDDLHRAFLADPDGG